MRLLLVVVAFLAACSRSLPDPDSAGARTYRLRCEPCHRLHDPGSLTAAMWEMQLDRKQPMLVRSGLSPLTGRERQLILSYLQAHSSDAPLPSPGPR